MNPNHTVHCCDIGCHANPLWHFGLKHLYLKDYAEFDSKIYYIMFLQDCLLACKISTVNTLT